MFWTKSLISTLKESPEGAESVSHKLMLRTGMLRMLMSGVYSYLPFGYRVLARIEKIIRQEMDETGAQELLLPGLQPLELWQKTGRDELLGETLIRFTDRRGRKLCLGPTHEEVITEVAANFVKSYRDLPFCLYQIQTKYRDELRPRFGVVRSCEFIMKDAYSFDSDIKGLDEVYEKMRLSYEKIFRRCGLSFVCLKAPSGVIGGDLSHEFMVPAENGEDLVYKCHTCGDFRGNQEVGARGLCPHCNEDLEKLNALEVGHIFKLGEKYSKIFNVKFLDEEGKQKIVQMGCFGIGVSRIIAAVIEQNHDSDGIIWPVEVAPYSTIIVPVNISDQAIFNEALKVHMELEAAGLEVILDDRDERGGVKFKDADLLGIPVRITIGKKWAKSKKIELKKRGSQETEDVARDELLGEVKRLLK